MLRNTRPLWTSSTRAFTSMSPASSRQFSMRAANASVPVLRISRTARITPIVPKKHYATNIPVGVNHEEEKKFAEQKLKPHPESVSTQSSVRHVYEPSEKQPEKDVSEGVKQDLETVKDTFALSIVPKESYVLGLLGTAPYLATSASTVYLSWVLNTAWPSKSSFVNNILISQESARYWLSVIEPIQLGYGAVIISFLGAIHWGLEYAEKLPSHNRTRFRYGIGVLASVVAWPTLLMPWNFALTSQFAAFVALYFADAQATIKGWTPHWYSAYRFVLTAIVGAAIMISLIGRANIGDAAPEFATAHNIHQTRGEEPYNQEWAKKEQKEIAKVNKEKEDAENKKQKEEAEKKKAEKKDGKSKDTKDKESDAEAKDDSKDGKDEKKDEKEGPGEKE